jgi:ion channel-forming bestrophin family protein
MLDYKSLSTSRLLRWQTRNIAIFTSLSILVVAAEKLSGRIAGVLPDVPVTVLGAAIGIYVSFRTNSAYDRWWEGRRLWGQLVNTSRHFCSQALAYLPAEELRHICRELVLHQILYVHALRCELRGDEPSQDEDVRRISAEAEVKEDVDRPGVTVRILRNTHRTLAQMRSQELIDARQLQSFDATLATLLDVQGGCERIRNTPLPPGYARTTELLIRTFAVMLPLAVVDELGWLAIPLAITICLAFKLISEVGRVLEDPFTLAGHALPLHSLSVNIERNLRDAIGDPAPPARQPDRRGILM